MVKVAKERRKPRRRKKAPSSDGQPYSLPTKPNVPPSDLAEYCLTIYGEKGVGKTSLAAQFPSSLVFMFEPRRRNLAIMQKLIKPVTREETARQPYAWEVFVGSLYKLIEEGNFRTVVIDTVDRCYLAAQDYVCWQQGFNHPSEAPKTDWGNTWQVSRETFEQAIKTLLFNDIGVIFLSHSRFREKVNAATSEEYEAIEATCTPQCFGVMKALSDFVFYYGFKGRQRVLMIRGSELLECACGVEDRFLIPRKAKDVGRAGGVQDRLISSIPMGGSAAEGYKNLCLAFDNKLKDANLVKDEPWNVIKRVKEDIETDDRYDFK